MKNPYQTHIKNMNLNKKMDLTKKTENSKPFQIKKTPDQSNMNVKKSKNTNLPISSIFGFVMVLGFFLTAYWNFEKIESILSRIEVGVLGQASAEAGPKDGKNTPVPEAKKETSASSSTTDTKTASTASTGMTSEEMSLFKSLEERKRQLDQREAELKKLEEELHKQKGELEKRLADLDQLRSRIGNQLQERVSSDEEKVNKLVEFYSNMKPQKAAKVFETMNEDLAVEILQKMKKTAAAEIMNLIEAEKARKLSEKFAGYRKN